MLSPLQESSLCFPCCYSFIISSYYTRSDIRVRLFLVPFLLKSLYFWYFVLAWFLLRMKLSAFWRSQNCWSCLKRLIKWLLGEVGRARRSSSALRSSLSPPGAGGRPPMPALLEEKSSPPPRVEVAKGCGSLIEGKLVNVSFLFTV